MAPLPIRRRLIRMTSCLVSVALMSFLFDEVWRFQFLLIEVSFQSIYVSAKERRFISFAGVRTHDLPHPRSREFDALDRSATVGRHVRLLLPVVEWFSWRNDNNDKVDHHDNQNDQKESQGEVKNDVIEFELISSVVVAIEHRGAFHPTSAFEKICWKLLLCRGQFHKAKTPNLYFKTPKYLWRFNCSIS